MRCDASQALQQTGAGAEQQTGAGPDAQSLSRLEASLAASGKARTELQRALDAREALVSEWGWCRCSVLGAKVRVL